MGALEVMEDFPETQSCRLWEGITESSRENEFIMDRRDGCCGRDDFFLLLDESRERRRTDFLSSV